MFPALADRFSTTGPPRASPPRVANAHKINISSHLFTVSLALIYPEFTPYFSLPPHGFTRVMEFFSATPEGKATCVLVAITAKTNKQKSHCIHFIKMSGLTGNPMDAGAW